MMTSRFKFDVHKKEWEGQLYENGTGKKIVGDSKLKLLINIFLRSC